MAVTIQTLLAGRSSCWNVKQAGDAALSGLRTLLLLCAPCMLLWHMSLGVFSHPTCLTQHTSLQHFRPMLGDAQLVLIDVPLQKSLSAVVANNCCAVLCNVMMCYDQ